MWSIISAAGWPIWPLIFASIIALAIMIERIWALRTSSVLPPQLVNDVCKTLNQFRESQNLTRLSKHSPLGDLLSGAILAHLKGQAVEDAIQEKASSLQSTLEKHLDVLSLIASAAPLMGLLGTVVGMIEIFAGQGAASQTPEMLANGISVALYNTAFGLIVSIPSLVAYRLFRIRINALMDRLELMIKPLEDALGHHHTQTLAKKVV